MFVSQITWWVPHVFVWRSPKRSKMSSHRAIRTPYEIHVDLHMAGAGWVRGPLGRQRARPASILNMPPRAPPAGVCAAGGARRSRTSLAGPGGVPIYFIWESKRTPTVWTPPRAQNPTGSVWAVDVWLRLSGSVDSGKATDRSARSRYALAH